MYICCTLTNINVLKIKISISCNENYYMESMVHFNTLEETGTYCPMKLIKSYTIKTPNFFFFQIGASVNLYVMQAKVLQKKYTSLFFFLLLKQYLPVI